MTDRVGVVRSAGGLGEAMGGLERLHLELQTLNAASPDPDPEGFEVANLAQLGRAVAELALRREESRGGHWRSDHPGPVETWRVRQTLTRTDGGELEAGLLANPEIAEVVP